MLYECSLLPAVVAKHCSSADTETVKRCDHLVIKHCYGNGSAERKGAPLYMPRARETLTPLRKCVKTGY